MLDTQGALVASLDENIGLSAEDWGWLPVAQIREGADLSPPADEDVSADADAPAGPDNSAKGSGQDLLAQAAAEDSFRFDFVPADEEAEHAPAAADGVTLDQLDLGALLAAGETLSFVAEWDFGLVTVEVRPSEETPPEETGGPGYEIVLSAVGSPAFSDAVL